MAVLRVASVMDMTDCVPDTDAKLRLTAQIGRLFGCAPQFGDIKPGLNGLLEAGNTLVSTLDSARLPTGVEPAGPLVMLVSAAPRNDESEWDNGVPFGYFTDPDTDTLVVTTLSEELLAGCVSQGRLHELRLLDIPTVMKWAQERLGVRPEEAEEIINTQFRSLWFQGLAARLVLEYGDDIPYEVHTLNDPPSPRGVVVRIDRFGHLIVDARVSQVPGFAPGGDSGLELIDGRRVNCYWRLTDVPNGALVAVQSSAGHRTNRHIMISVAGLENPSAAVVLGLRLGDQVLHPRTLMRS